MSSSTMESNITQIKINDMIDLFLRLYSGPKVVIKDIPSLMLWGAPGVGKSKGIKAFGNVLEERTGKTVVFTDVRLLLFNPVDLRGIPVADAKRETAIWLKPQIFQMDPNPNIINILFLDEISAAPLSVQAAAYQMTLDRVVGEHKLPDNCIILAAGNRVTDKSVAFKMPKALAGRFVHFEIIVDIDDWKKWAIPHGVDSTIISWLNFKNTALFSFDPSNDDVAFPSPRSWEMVDKFIKLFNGDMETAYPLIAGAIGKGAATEFRGYIKVFDKLPSIQEIYDGVCNENPSRDPAILYALSAALVSYSPKATITQLENLLHYFNRIPTEYAVLIAKDTALNIPVQKKLLACAEWAKWCKTNKGFIV
jgi:hypothetical protein